jgi:hypothetical protein
MLTASQLPTSIPGQPEPGIQVDMFGVEYRYTPKGRGQVTQISMDDQLKIENLKKEAKHGRKQETPLLRART